MVIHQNSLSHLVLRKCPTIGRKELIFLVMRILVEKIITKIFHKFCLSISSAVVCG